ncbi:MAG: hypothetical protein AB8G99_20975 [Planctomycetaceae bacterium]
MSGIPIERDPELADSAYFDAVTAVNLVVGRLSVKRPARVLFKVPKDVVGDAREPEKATTQTVHWKTGDEPVDFDKEIFATRTVATLKW